MKAAAPDTYIAPAHGWTCFHCGETFTTVGAARDHFGRNIYDDPGCMVRVQVGEERGLLMELRKAQAEVEHLRRQIDSEPERKWIDMRIEVQLGSYRAFRGCRTIQDVFNLYDSMEGRALAAEERAATYKHLEWCRASCDTPFGQGACICLRDVALPGSAA